MTESLTCLRKHYWSLTFVQVVSFFFLLGCDEEPVNPPPDFKLWINLQDSRIVTDSPVEVPFEWVSLNAMDLYLDVYLRLHDPGDLLLKELAGPTHINVRYASSSVIPWDGRIPAVDVSSGRRIPVVPGYYNLRLYEWSNLNKPSTAIQIVANAWDTDSDGISDAVEEENQSLNGHADTPIVDETGTAQWRWFVPNSISFPPTVSLTLLSTDNLFPNRGTHDYTIASGIVSQGELVSGLRLAHSGVGYQSTPSVQNCDPLDSDNWATLEMVNLIERVGREWHNLHPYPAYPIITAGDMSKGPGGPFPGWEGCRGHRQHENGLEVDMRYLRTDNSSDPVDISSGSYSLQRSQELINLFLALGNVVLIYSSDTQLQGTTLLAGHTNHFHVWIADPDGANN